MTHATAVGLSGRRLVVAASPLRSWVIALVVVARRIGADWVRWRVTGIGLALIPLGVVPAFSPSVPR